MTQPVTYSCSSPVGEPRAEQGVVGLGQRRTELHRLGPPVELIQLVQPHRRTQIEWHAATLDPGDLTTTSTDRVEQLAT